MMRIDIATLFPEMCQAVLSESIVGRAIKKQLVQVNCHNIRNYTNNKHNRVDDTPYGGGNGMVMQCQPIYDCYKAVEAQLDSKPKIIYMSPQGKTLTQQKVVELSKLNNIFILCGHYEGVDERVLEELEAEEISVGDYVLTGGELPALVLVDSIVRLCDGVLSNNECFEIESHYNGLLEFPQYTRPEEWKGRRVPPVLLSGHHGNIDTWRAAMSIKRTLEKRPDMLKESDLTQEQKLLLKKSGY